MATMFVFILVVQWWVNSYAMIYEKFKINESSVCLMLQIDTHMKKNINTQTHEDSHFLFSQSPSNEPQTHLVQSSQANTHTALDTEKGPPDVKWKAYACADGMKVIEEVLWLQGCQFESPNELWVE